MNEVILDDLSATSVQFGNPGSGSRRYATPAQAAKIQRFVDKMGQKAVVELVEKLFPGAQLYYLTIAQTNKLLSALATPVVVSVSEQLYLKDAMKRARRAKRENGITLETDVPNV
jgi:hypothetical protein